MKNNTLKTEKIMATSSIKKAIRYTISFYNCEMLHFDKESRQSCYIDGRYRITLTLAM